MPSRSIDRHVLAVAMFGTGFEPEEDSLRSQNAISLALRSLRSLMRGTGFEPADPYGIAS